jgi:release factor glutamine methyltransferase
MQLRAALQAALKSLLRHHVPSAQLAAELLMMHVIDRDRSYIYSHPESELPPESEERYFRMVAERAAGKPTQYITGHQEFWGMDFEVTPEVLIPRPETEQVVEMVLELSKRQGFDKNARLRLVDVGAGSGCIALALASEFPRAVIFSTDISRRALVVASRNAVRLGMPERVKFLESDLLDRLLDADFLGAFDFVVSNPPYVGREEVDRVQREVREHEPLLAWGGLERGDEIYARLFPQAARALKPGGYVVVEIGYNMRDRALALLGVGAAVSHLHREGGPEESGARTAADWSDIEVHPDLAGIPRVVIAKRRL